MSLKPKEIKYPWRVQGHMLANQSYSAPSPVGKLYIFSALFSCGTNVVALVAPNGAARFARLAAETNWALEEKLEADAPPACLAAFDQAWRIVITAMADANRSVREEERAA